ncbi:hypothetical protein BEI_3610 [Halomonas beimenensis]|uniref:Uncharacterized protein n=1 Tax=Halomonas beimenensis TaxID=475662 RepID=A0A291PCI2_9GAMM|nr:hypothetical protein BEI_3610 [Halomonas beimenensis]
MGGVPRPVRGSMPPAPAGVGTLLEVADPGQFEVDRRLAPCLRASAIISGIQYESFIAKASQDPTQRSVNDRIPASARESCAPLPVDQEAPCT